MNRRDAAAILALAGATALWASLSGAMFQYIRPSMQTWVAVSGAALVVIGLAELWRTRAGRPDDHRNTRLGWLIALPVCVAVTVGSGSLGTYAVGRNSTFRDLPDAPTSFDLEQYVRSASFGGQAVEMTLVDATAAASTPETLSVLDGHEVELTGFAIHDDDGTVRLTRFVISCCAADAVTVQVVLEGNETFPKDGTWLTVQGALGSGKIESEFGVLPTLKVSTVDEVDEPAHSYEVPFSRIR